MFALIFIQTYCSRGKGNMNEVVEHIVSAIA